MNILRKEHCIFRISMSNGQSFQTSSLLCTTVYFSKFTPCTIFSSRNLSISAIDKCLRASAFLPHRYAKYPSKPLAQKLVTRGKYFLHLYFDLILGNQWSKMCLGWALQYLHSFCKYSIIFSIGQTIVSQEAQLPVRIFHISAYFMANPSFHGKSLFFFFFNSKSDNRGNVFGHAIALFVKVSSWLHLQIQNMQVQHI